MVLAVFVRGLREGKTYADFRKAWLAEKGFGVPTRVVSGQRQVGFERVAEQEQVRHDRIDEVIEAGMTRTFYVWGPPRR
jgi:hypothetical protein